MPKKILEDDDAELLVPADVEKPTDLYPVVGGVCSRIPFKFLGLLFVLFMFLSSDVFIKRILGRIDGAVGFGNTPTTYGTVITGVLLVIFVAIADALIKNKVL